MKRRNRADIGVFIVAIIVIAILFIIPLKQYARSEKHTSESLIQGELDYMTDRVKLNREFTVSDYERLSNAIYNAGSVYDIELQVGRFTEDLRQYEDARLTPEYFTKLLVACGSKLTSDFAKDENKVNLKDIECATVGSLMTVAAHVHGTDCYVGHNHKASGCTSDGKGWSCGLDGDDSPVCDNVITNVSWAKNQSIRTGHGLPIVNGGSLDSKLNVTYLDGHTAIVYAKVPRIDDSYEHTIVVDMVYNAHFGSAKNLQTTKTFPVTVTITLDTVTCSRCGLNYDVEANGTDGGCPFCSNYLVEIKTLPEKIYVQEGVANPLRAAKIIAVYADGHEEVNDSYTSTYNPGIRGDQTVTLNLTGVNEVEYKENGIAKKVSIPLNSVAGVINVRTISYLTCSSCYGRYACNADGSDPGCPYCNDKAYMITVVPARSEYSMGEPLDFHVYAYFKNGQVELNSYEWTSDYDPMKLGNQQVHIFYGNLIEEIGIMVVDPNMLVCPMCGMVFDSSVYSSCPACETLLTGIYAEAVPSTLNYGDSLVLDVWGVYASGAHILLTSGYTYSGYDPFVSTVQTVTVEYLDYTYDVTVSVLSKASPLPTNTTICPNGHFYLLEEDGSDNGCPFCAGEEEYSAENGVHYTEMMYTSEILAVLNTYGKIEFNEGDSFTIIVKPRAKSIVQKVLDIGISFETEKEVFTSGITIGR